jgi:hypothetical protein
MKVLGVVALAAGAAAASAATSSGAAPQRIATTCTFEKGVAVVVEPSRRRAVITDAGRTADQFGQPIQDPSSNRLVGILTARGLTTYGCRRVAATRTTPRTSHLIGPWPTRVFSRVLCGYGGKAIRLDAIPLRTGGYRLTITFPPTPKSPFLAVAVPLRGSGGGVSFDMGGCIRLGK